MEEGTGGALWGGMGNPTWKKAVLGGIKELKMAAKRMHARTTTLTGHILIFTEYVVQINKLIIKTTI